MQMRVLSCVEDYTDSSKYSKLTYMAELQTHWDEGNVNILDPQLYVAKTGDEDSPSFNKAIHGDAQE
jgi:hypothetical protein